MELQSTADRQREYEEVACLCSRGYYRWTHMPRVALVATWCSLPPPSSTAPPSMAR